MSERTVEGIPLEQSQTVLATRSVLGTPIQPFHIRTQSYLLVKCGNRDCKTMIPNDLYFCRLHNPSQLF